MIRTFAEELQFPEEAIESLTADLEKMLALPDGQARLDVAKELLYRNSGKEHLDKIRELAQESGVHPYAADMVFALYSAPLLREHYRERGYSDALFLDTMDVLTQTLISCKTVKGIWGTFVGWWYPRVFRMELFRLGKLRYEHIAFRAKEYCGIRRGDTVINCHIPSSGPLRREEVLDSFKRAYAFYREEFKNGIMPVVCNSWLLYPPMYEVFPEGGNLRRFYELFDIIETKETDLYRNLWRVFGVENVPLKDLPENTTLQRRLKAYLLEGKSMGNGYGIILFDGEKVLK